MSISSKKHNPSKRIAGRSLKLPLLNKQNATIYPEDAVVTNIYDNGFEELSSWLITLLEQGIIVLMTEIKAHYKKVLVRRKEPYTSCSLRASTIRARLQFKFGKDLVSYHRNKHEDLYVVLNDLSLMINRTASASIYQNKSNRKVLREGPKEISEHTQSEAVFDTVQILRESIQEFSHYFTMLQNNRSSLIDFDSSMFWNCIPVVLKNFIGMLTMSNRRLNELKTNYDFYSCISYYSSAYVKKTFKVYV